MSATTPTRRGCRQRELPTPGRAPARPALGPAASALARQVANRALDAAVAASQDGRSVLVICREPGAGGGVSVRAVPRARFADGRPARRRWQTALAAVGAALLLAVGAAWMLAQRRPEASGPARAESWVEQSPTPAAPATARTASGADMAGPVSGGGANRAEEDLDWELINDVLKQRQRLARPPEQ